MDFQEMHRQLLDPATYPEPTSRVEYRETHISRVYLTDRHAYKFKKPLALGFLDYSTLERRGFYCAEEVRLNQRFAPDTYLGVVSLRTFHGTLHFKGPGTLLEFAVHMRRLPDERMLDRLIDQTDLGLPGEIERLARHLAPLLASSAICRNEAEGGHAAIVRTNCEENLVQTIPVIGRALSAEAHRVMTAITREQHSRLEPAFAAREKAGYVRDGHGDLHARNICMTDPVQIYDCIEFCRRLRIDDIAAELAFLLMDLDFRSRRDLAGRFLAVYQEHAHDPGLVALLPFYKSYRAWVRGKVEALLADETDVAPELRQAALDRSRRYFNLALGYHVPRMLLLTTGLMGVGKSTFARALAEALGAEQLRSDVIRKELAAVPSGQYRRDRFGEGLYAREMTTRTYREMRHRAELLLRRGRTVIVDASFARQDERQAFLDLADSLSLPVRLLHLHCDKAIAMVRLDRRQKEGQDASDGRRELFEAQAAAFEPIPDSPLLITIDSSRPVDYNVQDVICRLLTG